MEQTPEQRIKSALQQGEPITLEYEWFDADPARPVNYLPVTFDPPLGGTPNKGLSPLSLSAILGGAPLVSSIPINLPVLKGLLDSIYVSQIDVTLFTEDKTVGAVEITLVFHADKSPVTWQPFDGVGFSVELSSLRLGVVAPADSKNIQLSALVVGGLTVEQLQLQTSVSLPELDIGINQTPNTYFTVADLFTDIGITVGTHTGLAAQLLGLGVTDLDISGNVTDKSFQLLATLEESNAPGTPAALTLIPDVLKMDQLKINFSYQPADANTSAIKAGFAAQLEFVTAKMTTAKGLQFQVSFEYTVASQQIELTGMVDVANTLSDWSLTGDKLYVGDIAQKLFGVSQVPEPIQKLYVKALNASYATSLSGDQGNTTYTFNGIIGGGWAVGGLSIKSQLSLSLSNDINQIQAQFALDNFVFDVGYKFSKADQSTALNEGADPTSVGFVKIEPLKLELDYDFSKHTASVTFGDALSVEQIVEWCVQSITGNPGFKFGEPWATVFDNVAIPAGSKLVINMTKGQESVEFDLPVKLTGLPFGFGIDQISVTYKAQPAAGEEKFSFNIEGKFPGIVNADGSQPADPNKLAWDPSNPGNAPTLPGSGARALQIDLVAVGQRVELPHPPDRVEKAIDDLVAAFKPEPGQNVAPLFPRTLAFNSQSSWLIGSRLVIKGQITVDLIFNDPQIYGAMLKIEKSPDGGGQLDAFAGLYFEILYRKVTDSIGEYYAAVTLPEQFQTIDLGEIVIHLPSFSIAIYTNGNFKVDVGFPYKADFSHSFGLTYLIFTGYGGFYFGVLDGATADSLPCFEKENWDAKPVIEAGLGLAVGIQRDLNAGPLKAGLEVMLQAVLQGTYAQFHLIKPYPDHPNLPKEVDYYKVSGLLRFVGQVTGSVDLVIISASFLVNITLTATMVVERYKAIPVTLSASLTISLKVKINLFIFKITITVRFHHTFTTEFTFGQASQAPFQIKDGATQMLLAQTPVTPATGHFDWVNISNGEQAQPLQAYLIPQLTRGTGTDAKQQPEEDVPLYVAVMYLSHPPATQTDDSVALSQTAANEADSFADFAAGLMLWMVNAFLGKGAHNTRADIEALELDYADALRMIELLQDPAARFTAQELNDFAAGFFNLKVDVPPSQSAGDQTSYGVVAFPMPAGLQLKGDGYTPVNPDDLLLDHAYLAKLFAMRGTAGQVGELTAAQPPLLRDQMLVDYAVLVLLQMADYIKTYIEDKDVNGRFPVSDVLPDASVVDKTAGIAGRFLFHGMRRADQQHEHSAAVFTLSNQAFNASGAADAASITLATGTTSWQVSLQGSDSMTLTAGVPTATPPPLLWVPSEVAKVNFDFQPQGVSLPGLPMSEVAATTISLNQGSTWADRQLFALPKPLIELTSEAGLVVHIAELEDPADVKKESLTTLSPSDIQWYASVDFVVKKVDGATTPTYAFVSADAAGMSRLVPFLRDNPEPVANVEIGYKVSGGFSTGSDTPSFRLIQTNLSTESRPQQQALLAVMAGGTSPADLEFLAGFWAGAVTSFDGYFLAYEDNGQGLPDALFDDAGEASLTLMLQIDTVGDTPTPYANYVSVPTQDKPLAAVVPSITNAVATLSSGQVGVRVVRDNPVDPDGVFATAAISYADNLDNLYSLLTCQIASVGSFTHPPMLETAGITPIDRDEFKGKMVFQHAFTPIQQDKTNNLPDMANPYWAIGLDVTFAAAWTDVFGNLAHAPSIDIPAATVLYTDPVPKLSAMPNLAFCYSSSGTDATLNVEFLFKTAALNALVQTVMQTFDTVSSLVPKGPWQAAKTLTAKLDVIQATLQSAPSKVLSDAYKTLSDIQQKLINERDQYGRLAYQLFPYVDAKSRVSKLLYSTLLNDNQGHAFDDGGVLLQLAKTIYGYYQDLLSSLGQGAFLFDMVSQQYVANGLANKLPILQIKDVLNDQTINLDYMYPADIEIALYRVGHIHPDFKDTPAVIESRSVVQPKPDQWNDESAGSNMPAYTFLQFAEAFAAGFAKWDMYVASGVVWDNGRPANGKQLWVVRWGQTGITPKFNQHSIAPFAITPLSTKLISVSVSNVEIYDPSTGDLTPADSAITATNVDLDLELKQFLTAVDTFLQPTLVVPATEKNGQAVKQILAKKKQVAEQLQQYVQLSLIDASPAQQDAALLGAAQERVKQSCLKVLGDFYSIDALVAVSLETTMGGASKLPPANLFGSVSLTPDQNTTQQELDNLQLSSAKAALSPSPSAMAFSVKSAQPRAATDYWAQASFEIGAIEHDVVNIDTGGTL